MLKFHACLNMSGLSVDRYKLTPDPFLRRLKTPVNPDLFNYSLEINSI